MKFSKEHYETLKNCIKSVIHMETLQKGQKSEIRYLWDIFWASRWNTVCREHYLEGNYYDAHIQTAVKTAIKDIEKEFKQRLEYLRGELRAERISYSELHELQTLVKYIDPSDVELLEAAGVPENHNR